MADGAKEVVKIFVSHRHEDERVARIVQTKLEELGAGRLKLFLSEDIPPGDEWFEWIRTHLDQANLMFFLYTGHTASNRNWDWCLYETARFEAKIGDSRIIILHSERMPPPIPLRHLQTIEVSLTKVKSFLKDLLGSKKYISEPINRVFADNDKSVTDLATVICTFFEEESLISIPRGLFLNLLLPLDSNQVEKIKSLMSDMEALEYIQEVIRKGCMVTSDSDMRALSHFGFDRWENGLTFWNLFKKWQSCPHVKMYEHMDWFHELSMEMIQVIRNTPAREAKAPLKSCSEYQTWYLPVVNRAQSSKGSCDWEFRVELYRISQNGVVVPSKRTV